jgi:hypothetical protein
MGRRRALFRSAPHHVQLAAREQADGRLGLAALRALRPLQLRRDVRPAGAAVHLHQPGEQRVALCYARAVVAPPDVGLVELELVESSTAGLRFGRPRYTPVDSRGKDKTPAAPRTVPEDAAPLTGASPAARGTQAPGGGRARPRSPQAGVPAAVAKLPYLEFVPNKGARKKYSNYGTF